MIWKALKHCIEGSVGLGQVHFERSFRHELETLLGECQLQRQAGSQWLVTTPSGKLFYASVRSEVVGSGMKGADLLGELKQAARRVKNTLLNDGASWLQWLYDHIHSGNTTKLLDNFLDDVRDDDGEDLRRPGRGPSSSYGGECRICWKTLSDDLLGGKHHCRIVAEFQCHGTLADGSWCSGWWTSQKARYNLEEERVMGQRCERCREFGVVQDWWVSDDAPVAGDPSKPHRSYLCEACDRYGNCAGAFFDPFTMTMAIRLYTHLGVVHWTRHPDGDLWTTTVNGSHVVLQPHVFAPGH